MNTAPINEENRKLTVLSSSTEEDYVGYIDLSDKNLYPVLSTDYISLSDGFLKYSPQNKNEENVFNSILKSKKEKLPDFRTYRNTPTFDKNGLVISKPQQPQHDFLCKSALWWATEFSKILPSKRSRMGSLEQFYFVLALYIKYLVETKHLATKQAWKMVCSDFSCNHFPDYGLTKPCFVMQNTNEFCILNGVFCIGIPHPLADRFYANPSKVYSDEKVVGFMVFDP
jgi:hypothetical protein